MTKFKFCGLRRECDIDFANEIRPDYIGFIFAKKSKRYVSPDDALALRQRLECDILPVGVFVNEPINSVADIAKSGAISLIQLHGREDEQYITALRKLTDLPIIKAFSVNDKADLQTAEKCSADYLLLDNGAGGTGDSFDWRLLENFSRPYFLAGGLNPGNVRKAVETYHPYAVDASSGIETDGVKNFDKMKRFAQNLRDAQSALHNNNERNVTK